MPTWRNFFLGHGSFLPPEQILEKISDSKNFDSAREAPNRAEALLIFQTTKQQTWLVATNVRLYCILDDIGKGSTSILWSMSESKLIQGGRLYAHVSTNHKTDKTGVVKIADRNGLYFSRKLFASESIERQIRRLIEDRIGKH